MAKYGFGCLSPRGQFGSFRENVERSGILPMDRKVMGVHEALIVTTEDNNRLFVGGSVVAGFEHIRQQMKDTDWIVYMHDDVDILADNWMMPIVGEVKDGDSSSKLQSDVVVVGLGGASRLGTKDFGKRLYRIDDLARGGYRSRDKNWGVHGAWLEHPEEVAVIDGFFMAVRTEWLNSIGGWTPELTFHCYDLWLCIMAHKTGKRVVALPIECHHKGGGTSTHKSYMDQLQLRGISAAEDHMLPHKWLYDNYRGDLPIVVPNQYPYCFEGPEIIAEEEQ